ncbi:hypothetical protein BJX61DRAFT_497938 [Aspergillus egyptiacus]|nr:hypothetical protein BJX61DRAFT_497938 [Aspergillus egyptiacus]
MARHTGHVSMRHSVLMLLTILTANTFPTEGLSLRSKQDDTCPGSSQKCTGSDLLNSFCCPSSSTCISTDSGSSVICCPDGQDCTYIEPITCNVSKQDASLYPLSAIKTTRLDDELPTCGDLCCPFGYTCQGKFCAMDDTPSTTTQSKSEESTGSTSATTGIFTESPTEVSTESYTETSTMTTAEATSDSEAPTAGTVSSIPTEPSNTVVVLSTPTLSQYSAASQNHIDNVTTTCSAFPTNAILAGFFPGSVFGAVAALLLTVCIRRHQRNNATPGEKVAQNTYRKSTGTVIGISDPIPTDETSFRTDFLLRTTPKRTSEGSRRSALRRSRSRVRSLFSSGHRINLQAEDIPPVPPLPMTPPPQRQPSTESIRVYSPPGVFASTGMLGPSPYPDHRPNTTLTEILDQVQTRAASAAGSNRNTGSTTAAGVPNRFLVPPQTRRKQLPH